MIDNETASRLQTLADAGKASGSELVALADFNNAALLADARKIHAL